MSTIGDAPANKTWGQIAADEGIGGGLPAGTIAMFAGASAPTGWLLCDGAAVSRSTYSDLFDEIGETYGAGNGTTTFNVPNLQGRVPIGLKSTDTDFDALGETGGAKTVASTGTNSAPTFTGTALGTHAHGQGSYAVADHSAHTHSVTSNVSVTDHASHTHTYTQVIDHVHAVNVGAAADTSTVSGAGNIFAGTTNSVVATTANPTGSAGATGTTAGPSATLTHSVTNNAVTSGNPSATLSHTFSGTSEAVSAGTPAGTVDAPDYTGDATSVVQPYLVINYIVKI